MLPDAALPTVRAGPPDDPGLSVAAPTTPQGRADVGRVGVDDALDPHNVAGVGGGGVGLVWVWLKSGTAGLMAVA